MQSKFSIELDAGFIFDVISIFNVKINLCAGANKDKSISNFNSLAAQIKRQIGQKLFDDIISSDEYRELYDANLHTFNLVDKAQKSDGLARDVAESNILRFHAKNKLQEKFFNCKTNEIKV